ncbi:MAG: hypothetical protein FWF51_04165 [Chitinivibrionia bacterium]|nr:hypothetical protein [Chitinivibrionia bacterium]
MKKIVLIATLFLAQILAKLPENPGFSVIDGGSGAVGNSPFLNAIFNTEKQKLVLETGAISYYDTPIFDKEEQITNFFCGALLRTPDGGGRLQNRISLSMSSLNAFDLYSETDVKASYGLSFAKILHFGIVADYLIYRSEGDCILGAGGEIAGGIGNKIIMGVFSYSIRNIGEKEYNPIIQDMKAVIRLKENKFGNHAAIFKIDNYTKRISAELAYDVNFYDNIEFGVSFIPKPFVVKIGLVFDIKQTRALAAFSLHNALGLSKHIAVQYLLDEN